MIHNNKNHNKLRITKINAVQHKQEKVEEKVVAIMERKKMSQAQLHWEERAT
jgi:hypothetical protein